jgi:hypothetical protein
VRDDNRIENLHLCENSAAHVRVCRTGRKYPRKSGGVVACERCGKECYFSKSRMARNPRFCSRACRYPKVDIPIELEAAA